MTTLQKEGGTWFQGRWYEDGPLDGMTASEIQTYQNREWFEPRRAVYASEQPDELSCRIAAIVGFLILISGFVYGVVQYFNH